MSSPGERIKELRGMANMSQEELGRRVGVQRAAIQKYEKGSVTNIPLSTIEKIAAVFSVSPTYLMGWEPIDQTKLAMEVRVIKGVEVFYGKKAVDLLELYSTLSKVGKQKILEYAHDIGRSYAE